MDTKAIEMVIAELRAENIVLREELESQEILNAILDAENIELREEVKLLRRRVQLEQQNRQLADVI